MKVFALILEDIPMKEVIDKLSSYSIFNYLLPGTLFTYFGELLTSYTLIQQNLLIGLFLYYFIGLVISRLGSFTVEPFLKWIEFVRFANYKDYVEASEQDPKVELFSEQNNMYRTLCSLFVTLLLFKIYDEIKGVLPWGDNINIYIDFIILIGLLILFLFSYKKQTEYVVKRVKIALEKE